MRICFSMPLCRPAKEIKEALHVADGVVFRGSKVVVPSSLRKRVVKLSHKGHQGVSKTKHMIRDFCWFPGIDNAVEEALSQCVPCLAVNTDKVAPPVKPHKFPKGPWQVAEMDLQGAYPNGKYLLVLIDRYSKWAEVSVFRHAPNAGEVKTALDAAFDSQGVPFKIQSDNGPPFQSAELRRYTRKTGFILKHITPEWPRANGEVERFNRTMKAALQKGAIEKKPTKETLSTFLRAYRATPHSTTGVSPYEAMYGRKMKLDVPLAPTLCDTVDQQKVERSQEKMKN